MKRFSLIALFALTISTFSAEVIYPPGSIGAITNLVNTNGYAFRVDSFNQLLQMPIPAVSSKLTALVMGRNAAGDGGGGIFFYAPLSSATTNGGTIGKPSSTTGRWFRVYDGEVELPWFDVPDGSSDNAPAFRQALLVITNSGTLYVPRMANAWRVASTIVVPPYVKIRGDSMGKADTATNTLGTIILSTADYPVFKFAGTSPSQTVTGFQLSDIQLYGNGYGSPLIQLYFANGVRFNRVEGTSRGIGIDYLSVWDSTFNDVRIDNSGTSTNTHAALRFNDTNYDGTVTTTDNNNNIIFTGLILEQNARAISMLQHFTSNNRIWFEDAKIESDDGIKGPLVEVSGLRYGGFRNLNLSYGSGATLAPNSTDLITVTNTDSFLLDGLSAEGVAPAANQFVKSIAYLESSSGPHIDSVTGSFAANALTVPGTSMIRFGSAVTASYLGNVRTIDGTAPLTFSGTMGSFSPYIAYGSFLTGYSPGDVNTNLFGMSFTGGIGDILNIAPEGGSDSWIYFKTATTGTTARHWMILGPDGRLYAEGNVTVNGNINFVTNTAAAPMLFRNGTHLEVKLGDGSGYTGLNIGDLAIGSTPGNFAIDSSGSITRINNSAVDISAGSGSPEGVKAAAVGSIYLRVDGGVATSLYTKTSGGSTSTGWTATGTGSGTITGTLVAGNIPYADTTSSLAAGPLARASASSFTVGGGVTLNNSAAKQLSITGDGTGATTQAGLILGYYGVSGYGAVWPSTVTPSTVNAALYTGSGYTALGVATGGILDFTINGSSKWNFNASGHLLASTDNTYDIGASGATRPRNVYVANNVNANDFVFSNGGSQVYSTVNGIITLYNSTSTDFSRLQLGGTTASFPSIKRNGTTLAIRLADDSADAPISAASAAFSGSVVSGGNISASASGYLLFTGRSIISSPSDGVLKLETQGGGAFSRIDLGGDTSSFPAIKRNGTGIDIRLADDSAYAPLALSILSIVNPGSGTPGLYLSAAGGNDRLSIGTSSSGAAGSQYVYFNAGAPAINIRNTWTIGWSSSATDPINSTSDTAFSRISAGVIGVGTGAAGSVAGNLQLGGGTKSSPGVRFGSGDGLYSSGAGNVGLSASAGPIAQFESTAIRIGSGVALGFSSNSDLTQAANDSSISRISPGLIGIGTGAQGSVAGSLSAKYYLASVGNALTATGTTRTDALQLAAQINNVTTAAAATGVILPVGVVGMRITIYNNGANPVQIYASASETIDGTAGSTGVVLTNAKRCMFDFIAANTWLSAQLGTTSN